MQMNRRVRKWLSVLLYIMCIQKCSRHLKMLYLFAILVPFYSLNQWIDVECVDIRMFKVKRKI